MKTVFLEEDEEATAGVEAAEAGVLLLFDIDAGDPVEDALVDESGPGGNGEGMITRRGWSERPEVKFEEAKEMADTLGGGEKAASTLDTYELGLPKSASEAKGTLTVHLGDIVEVAEADPNREKLFTAAAAAAAAATALDSSQP